MTARTRVYLVEDHPIVRLGIHQIIDAEPGLSVCGESETAEQALDQLRGGMPDLVIVDLRLRGSGGLQLIRALHGIDPALPVLVLSMHDEALFAERALKAGARGYIMKHEAIGGLVTAIREVLAGRIYLSAPMSQRLLSRVGPGTLEPAHGVELLTDRELEVFELIGRGIGTTAIGEMLGVSVKTIETYRANIKSKLDLKDAFELVRYATSWVEGQ